MSFFKAPDGRMYASKAAYRRFCKMIAEETFARRRSDDWNKPQPKQQTSNDAGKPKAKVTPTLERKGVRLVCRETGVALTGEFKTGEAAKLDAICQGHDLAKAMLVPIYGAGTHKPTWVKRAGVCPRGTWF